MSKDKKPAAPPTPEPAPMLNLRLGHEREKRLAAWMATQRVKPLKTAVVLQAVDEFLDREEAAEKR